MTGMTAAVTIGDEKSMKYILSHGRIVTKATAVIMMSICNS